MTKELNQEYNQPDSNTMLKLSDYVRRVRDLELQLIDQKASTERRFNAMREALFSKLERDVKTIESK